MCLHGRMVSVFAFQNRRVGVFADAFFFFFFFFFFLRNIYYHIIVLKASPFNAISNLFVCLH